LFDPLNQIKTSQAILIAVSLMDLQEDYRYEVKRAFLRFILEYFFPSFYYIFTTNCFYRSDYQKRRLYLEQEPPEFPQIIIRAPIPWKVNIQVAVNRLDQILMVNHPVLTALNILWFEM
jgi:dynein heavy chain, axonemal